jgi:hypothetical protein
MRNEISPPTSKLVALLTIKTQGGALKLKRALRVWGWPKFAENLGASPFNKIYQMINLAGSVLLDNTFKYFTIFKTS